MALLQYYFLHYIFLDSTDLNIDIIEYSLGDNETPCNFPQGCLYFLILQAVDEKIRGGLP